MASSNPPAKKNAAAPPKAKTGKGEGGVRVSRAEFAAGAARPDQVPTSAFFEEAPEIAFAGRSNVGKSSLLNMILSRKGLARTSNTPGRTRQINFFDVRLASGDPEKPLPPRIVFVDLPGYGYAKVSKTENASWKELLEGYLHERPALRAVVILIDIRRGLEQEELDLVEFLRERPAIKIIIAVTKIDKLPLNQQKPALARLTTGLEGDLRAMVATSAETGEGREALWNRMLYSCRA